MMNAMSQLSFFKFLIGNSMAIYSKVRINRTASVV